MQLFDSDRAKADELLEAMKKWIDEQTEMDEATLSSFSAWVKERSEIAGNTTPVSQLREKSW